MNLSALTFLTFYNSSCFVRDVRSLLEGQRGREHLKRVNNCQKCEQNKSGQCDTILDEVNVSKNKTQTELFLHQNFGNNSKTETNSDDNSPFPSSSYSIHFLDFDTRNSNHRLDWHELQSEILGGLDFDTWNEASWRTTCFRLLNNASNFLVHRRRTFVHNSRAPRFDLFLVTETIPV